MPDPHRWPRSPIPNKRRPDICAEHCSNLGNFGEVLWKTFLHIFFDFWGTVNTSIIDMIKQASAISDQTGANAFVGTGSHEGNFTLELLYKIIRDL